MSTFLQDLRYARRLLTKNPGFTAIAVLTLALGIGLNTAVFSVIDALLLRPLPGVRQSEEIVQVFRTWPGIEYGSSSPMNMRDLQERSKAVFTDVAAWSFESMNISVGGQTQRVFGQLVSANYFSVLGATPLRGRTFVADEDRTPGAHPVVVVSHAAWQGTFGGDPQVVGRSIVLNGAPYTIIGVTRPEFRGVLSVVTPTIWVPLMQVEQVSPHRIGSLTSRGNQFMNLIARLQPAMTVQGASTQVAGIVKGLEQDYPEDYRGSSFTLVAQSDAGIHPMFRNAQVGLSAIVMAVVVMLLLIACVNVANLFLARARDRWREMAVRLSLGARRGVIIRQLLTESLLFAMVSGAVGLLIAWWCMRLLNRIQLPFDAAISAELGLSIPVLIFTIVATIATGVMFGLAPALQATRPALIPALKGEAPTGDSRSRASRALVVAQMALSMVLLVSAGLFLRNLRAATTVDKGFTGGNILLAELEPGLQGYDRGRATQFFATLEQRLALSPDVEGVSWARDLPLGLSNSQSGVRINGYTPSEDEQMSIDNSVVSPSYFDVMGIRVVQGRAFTAQDDSSAQKVLVVNQRFAERFWAGQNAVGKMVRTRGEDRLVIGVVPTGKYQSLGEAPRAYMYFPQAQMWSSSMMLQLRTKGDPTSLVPLLRSEVAALDANLPVANIRTLTSHLGIALMPARLAGGSLAVFGVLGLLLASVGIYGVMSYSVAQRTREIGIRMAIGAARGEVVGLVMRQGLTMVAMGAGIGLALAFGAAQLIRGLLYGGNALDPVTFIGVPLVLAGVAALAIWVPARRAAAVDPVRAMRTE
jgi:predicted permease